MLFSGRRVRMVKPFGSTEGRFIYRRVLGIQTIPLNKVVGSVGRYQFLRDDFMPLDGKLDSRHHAIRKLIDSDYPLPPIEVYKVRDEYYVLDGNHRVAICKDVGKTDIDANVIEFVLRPDTEENRLYLEQQHFIHTTGLEQIELSEPQYGKLLSIISEYNLTYLRSIGKEPFVNLKLAALDWYYSVYRPVIDDPRLLKALKSFPGKTLADLFIHICDYQWIRSREEACAISMEQAIKEFSNYTSSSKRLNSFISRIAHALPWRLPYWLYDSSDAELSQTDAEWLSNYT